MHLQDYMKYPDMACRMGFVPRFRWNGRPVEIISYVKVKKVLYVLGTLFLVYQDVGELVHWHLVGRKAEGTASFVAELSEATGAFMLTSIGICNIWALTHYRAEINEVLTELEELYPRPREMHYRRQHYFELANRLMKYEFIFYVAFCAYYNGAPLLVLLYEHLMDGKEMRYKLQINTWYPWRTHGSALGYGIGFLCTVLSSIEGVAFSVATHHILCIVTYNLKLHYDSLSEQLLALDSRHPDANRTLRKLIAYHCQILNLGDKVNHILDFSFLAALICATVAICMTSVAVLLLDPASAFKYINGLAAFVVYNFVICYLGTEVTIAVSLERI
ncbi:putative odorant receptor 69a [Drosophila serrata]|uniref:putative odorant receptor 69a n=1 Tax=Drosophila serrata TaxID=7274 RepID=UPI000A1D0D38|nr:putative odorant receptor 69a [Drosophila serrata]